jgi:hypothetical protein
MLQILNARKHSHIFDAKNTFQKYLQNFLNDRRRQAEFLIKLKHQDTNICVRICPFRYNFLKQKTSFMIKIEALLLKY